MVKGETKAMRIVCMERGVKDEQESGEQGVSLLASQGPPPPVLILYCPEMPGSFPNRPYPAGVGFTYLKVLEFAASIPQIQSSPQILISPRLGLTDRLGVQLSLDNIKGGSADSQTWSFTA